MDPLPFDPLVAGWFGETFAGPTPAQQTGWASIGRGEDTLIAAPTGSGKTLAAFLSAIDGLVRRAQNDQLPDGTCILYVSPLKALGNDIEKNLEVPLAGIRERAESAGISMGDIRVAVRSGDTPASKRQAMLRKPPHILITTPESLYILLTAVKSRQILRHVESVIVDEVHAICHDKRGSHLALSLARLDRLITTPDETDAAIRQRPQRIGLSATQKPIDQIARWFVGTDAIDTEDRARCTIVDTGHKRAMELSVETVDLELSSVASHEMRDAIYDRITELVQQHQTTIVFVNTRRLVERVAHALGERLGTERVVAHHGSLSKKIRLEAEDKLKSGQVPVVVATASLELGIDVGHVDLVCHLGAPRAIATLLQRVGRSGHWLGQIPKGVFFPLTRDEMVQTAAAVRAIRQGELDRIQIPESCLDILAQQIVATVANEDISVPTLRDLMTRATPYRNLDEKDFNDTIEMLAEGFSTRRGRRSAMLHFDRVHQILRARRGARLRAITGGGAIPDTGDYDVIEEPTEARVGTVNEDFAIDSTRGDIFLLGNHSWRVRRVEMGKVRVEDAGQSPPTIPFWFGEAPARTPELSQAVADLRQEVADRFEDPAKACEWVVAACGIDSRGAQQIVTYIGETVQALGAVPTCDRLIAERFFDESGGMQLVIHCPLGGDINRAFGLALRKRFCVGFDFELQAAATDDGIVLSLGEQHSFPLPSIFEMIHPDRVEKDLVQAALQAPLFTNRWRWNATRALALSRSSGGKKVPIHLQRMRAEDLLAAVFPAQLGCGDNRAGPIPLVDHPLVNETIGDCLHEAMNTRGLESLLRNIRAGKVITNAIDTPAPSPMAHEILNANPYAFLDDAPLEERRARAVSLRRTDDSLARGMGALDADAIKAVQDQAWPDIRDAEELHDALLDFIWLPMSFAERYPDWIDELIASDRASFATSVNAGAQQRRSLVAAERVELARKALPDLQLDKQLPAIAAKTEPAEREDALVVALRGWMECLGPTTAAGLSELLGLSQTDVEVSLARLEAEGVCLRGSFTPGMETEEWCERRLLARIHRHTLGKLRREIEPVSQADFMRFLFRWQHIGDQKRLHGSEGTAAVVRQLQGLEIPAPAWEQSVLPLRVENYQAKFLDELCLGGVIAWGRFSPPVKETRFPQRRAAPSRSAPLGLMLREDLPMMLPPEESSPAPQLTPAARDALNFLQQEGASFLADIARATGLLPSAAEDALWELVARGLVAGDGFAGLRMLLHREDRKRPDRRLRGMPGGRGRMRGLPIGRWACLKKASSEGMHSAAAEEGRVEDLARLALQRWGVVFREILSRESLLPTWRELHQALRRLEARGEIRGGRFVSGFLGEQFATTEAIAGIRAVRNSPESDETILIAAADPLNLSGIITPGSRVSAQSTTVIAYKAGVPLFSGDLGEVRSRLQKA